jgi:hypothetical protein
VWSSWAGGGGLPFRTALERVFVSAGARRGQQPAAHGLKEGEREALSRAIKGAARRLERPRCRRIFQDFNDTSGRLLEEALEAAGRSGPGLLQDWIFFADGRQAGRCADGRVLAFTQTGSRAVWICGHRFSEERWRDPAWTELVLIHEALHVLGLGEDPPSSEAISRRVLDRCGG